MNTINCQTKLEYSKDYLFFDVKNSAFEDLLPVEANVSYTLETLPLNGGGIIIEFKSLDKLILECNTETGSVVDVLDAKKLEEFSVNFETGDDKVTGLRLDGINIDMIKKTIILKFNES